MRDIALAEAKQWDLSQRLRRTRTLGRSSDFSSCSLRGHRKVPTSASPVAGGAIEVNRICARDRATVDGSMQCVMFRLTDERQWSPGNNVPVFNDAPIPPHPNFLASLNWNFPNRGRFSTVYRLHALALF